MNRVSLIISSAFIAALIAGLVVYSWYIAPQNSPKPEFQAKITSFTADTSFKGCVVGVTTDIWFNVTVQNTGRNDINGANITVTRIPENSTPLCSYDSQSLGVLRPNETRQVKAIILTDLGHFSEVASSNFKAILIVNGTVWDEHNLF